MRIVILGWVKFPFASAGASRVRMLSKGWIEEGAVVHLITTATLQSDENPGKGDSEFSLEGFTYESTQIESKSTFPFKHLRIIQHISSLMTSWKRVRQLIAENKCDVLYLWGWSGLGCYPVIKIARKNKIPFFFDICEWFPRQRFKWWFINPLFYDDLIGRMLPGKDCGGIIAITNYIAQKYEKKSLPVVIVPAINDFSVSSLNISTTKGNVSNKLSVLYAGFCKPDDGVDYLLGAIKIVANNDIPVELTIIGADGKSGTSLQYQQQCEQDQIDKLVHFRGMVSESDYSKLLSSAGVLILPRKNCQVNLAAFPTRLPEFLATGRPVLTTDVPDISLYLEADIHAKIVEADRADAIATGLIDLWKDSNRADNIGKAGQEQGALVFDYRNYTKLIYSK